MTIRQEILQEIQTFLQKESKQKKDYRTFVGNLKRLKDTPRLQNLTSQELTTCQQVQEFLKQ
jgi:transposase